ncbi:hypothetical protein G5I_02785 [Acromyrmex echinatior]|uniref:Uncharacterized protein n=1 Tax=Acromyrmex echinatior TaxID=103372 RepID=F4WB79_ACREC|nr:hypothetical protein G5I_02785 [Acromyrmex echinatior]
MLVPTFVDLQGFIVNKKFIVKEVAVLKQGIVLTHYIFTSSVPWKFLTRSDRSCASWLTAYHHGLRWEDGMVPYNETKHLITAAVFENDAIVHGPNKRIYTSKINRAKGVLSIVAKSSKSTAFERKSEILGISWRKGVKVANVLITNSCDTQGGRGVRGGGGSTGTCGDEVLGSGGPNNT